MENNNAKAYSEVIEILKLVDDEKKLEALPIEMLEVLKSKADPEYKPKISMEIPLEEQALQSETYSILSWIASKYWSENLETNNIEQKQSENNEEVVENIQSESNKIEGNILLEEDKQQTNEINLPIAYSDLKWYQKIKMKVIELLNKLFKRNKKNTNYEQEGNIL